MRKIVRLPDEHVEARFARGEMTAEALEEHRAYARERERQILSQAIDTVWQLSSGPMRRVREHEPEDLFTAFHPLIDFGEDFDADAMLRLEADDGRRITFINPAAVDFISLPTHTFEAGRDLIHAHAIDAD